MWWLLSFFVIWTVGLAISYTFVGNEETLRQNIIDLVEGKLKFSEKILPFYKEEISDFTPENNNQYDFIIIGAGSAGAVVASRLSEIENVTVLLVEAGSEEYPLMDIPMIAGLLQFSDQINWGYYTEKSDKYCRGFTDSKCYWPRGKVAGGSSVLNYMTATRGNKGNYDDWAIMTGDESWSFKNMLKYFKKLENFNVNDVEFNSEYRNKGGPVHISGAPYNTELAASYIEAGRELGFPVIDYNAEEQIGFSYIQNTIINGERWSTNRAYLQPARGRANLFFTKNSHVNRILINEESKSAYGIEISKNDKTFVVKAKKEVILSAGAVNSPQILMLSGIGPAEHLSDFGINVIKDARVGENLNDHITYGGLVFKTNLTLDSIKANMLDPRNPSIKDYLTERNGTLALGAGFGALSFLNVDNRSAVSGKANIELILGLNSGLKDPIIANLFRVSNDNLERLAADKINTVTWSMWSTVTEPRSRGRLLLRSTNPNVGPKIYPNYYDDPEDLRVMIKGIRLALEISQSNAFRKYDSKLIDMPLPCNDVEYNSDAYWECAIRTFTSTVYHPTSTCKMGREDDPTAVVNPKLQVIGVKGLRVIDASIMPKIITGHTNIPTIAIAEKISDIIKEDWGYKV